MSRGPVAAFEGGENEQGLQGSQPSNFWKKPELLQKGREKSPTADIGRARLPVDTRSSAARSAAVRLLLHKHQKVLVLTYDTDCTASSLAPHKKYILRSNPASCSPRPQQADTEAIRAHLARPFVRPNEQNPPRARLQLLVLVHRPTGHPTALVPYPRNLSGKGSVGSTPQHHECLNAPRGPRLRTLVCACVRCGYQSTVAETDGPLASSHDVKALLRSLRRLLAGTLFPAYSDLCWG